MQKMGFYINISRFSINIPRFSHSRCNTVGISSAHRSRIVWVRVRRMRRQLILLWLLHFSATVLSFLTISAPSTTESVPSPSIPSLRPSHLMLPFSPSPLSSSQSKVSDFRPQHSQSYAAAAATTVPRLSPCFCFRMRVEYSNRRLRRRSTMSLGIRARSGRAIPRPI